MQPTLSEGHVCHVEFGGRDLLLSGNCDQIVVQQGMYVNVNTGSHEGTVCGSSLCVYSESSMALMYCLYNFLKLIGCGGSGIGIGPLCLKLGCVL